MPALRHGMTSETAASARAPLRPLNRNPRRRNRANLENYSAASVPSLGYPMQKLAVAHKTHEDR